MASYDYTKYDYDALIAEITRLVSEQDEWTDAYQSSTAQVLIQIVASVTDQLHYMLERRTEENFLSTAELGSSVRAIVSLIGYRPRRRISSRGKCEITIVDSAGTPIQPVGTITIPKYSSISYDGKFFVTEEEIVLTDTTTYPFEIDIIEGTKEQLTFDSSDVDSTLFTDQYVELSEFVDVENDSLYITTPTQTFVDVLVSFTNQPPIGAIGFASPTDEVFDILVTNTGMQIIFGDGLNGEKPVGIVTIEWIKSSGVDVSVVSIDNKFILDDYSSLTDHLSNVYEYTITNTTSIVGGADEETVQEIKDNAPTQLSTSNRTITKEDFKYWLTRANIGDIVDSNIYGEEEIGITTINANNVYITYLLSTGEELTDSLKDDLISYLEVYKQITTNIVLNNAEIVPVQVNLSLKRGSTLSAANSEVFDYIKSELTNYLSFQEGSLANNLYHSELVDHFHDLTITRAGLARLIADYVNIELHPLKEVTFPSVSTVDKDIIFTYGTDTDVYTITLNGIDYSYTTVATNTAVTVASILTDYLNLDPSIHADIDATDTTKITISRETHKLENLVLHSEDFAGTSWDQSAPDTPVITANSTLAPDGSTTASTLNDNSGTVSMHLQTTFAISADNLNHIGRIFIKKDADTSRFPALRLEYTGGTSRFTVVQLNTNTGDTTVAAGDTPSINVWDTTDYWVLEVGLPNNSTNTSLTMQLYPSHDTVWDSVGAVAATGSIIAWGAQLALTETELGTYWHTDGKSFSQDFHTFPYENRLLYSEDFDNAVWIKTNTTITADNTTAPDGTVTADKIVEANDTDQHHYISETLNNVPKETVIEASAYFKVGERNNAHIEIYDSTNTVILYGVAIDLTTGSMTEEINAVGGTDSYTITAEANGFFRLTLTTKTTTLSDVKMSMFVLNGATKISYNGDGTSGIYVWGGQFQQDSTSVSDYMKILEHPLYFYNRGYTITDENSTIPNNVDLNENVQLPDYLLNNDGSVQIILPESVEIIRKSDQVIVATDNSDVSLTGNPTLTFADANPDTITRDAGDWIADGFAVNMDITVANSASNNGTYKIKALSSSILTVDDSFNLTVESAANITVVGVNAGIIWSGNINYATGVIQFPVPPSDDYIIRFKQNTNQNIFCNEKQTLTYYPCKESYITATEELSTIVIY